MCEYTGVDRLHHASDPSMASPLAQPSVMSAEPTPHSPRDDVRSSWRTLPQMRYPDGYVWLVFFSSLDIMLTWAILARGGSEVNPIAAIVIDLWGLPGAIVFKFSLMLFVILVCEVVARSRPSHAYALIWLAVWVSAMPVAYSLGLLVLHTIYVVQ